MSDRPVALHHRRRARPGPRGGARARGRAATTSSRSTSRRRSRTPATAWAPRPSSSRSQRECEARGAACLIAVADVRDDAAVKRRRRGGHRALRPHRPALQQRRHLRLRARARAERGRVGRDDRHQPQGRVDRRAPRDPAHDRGAGRLDHQQLLDRRPARHGPPVALRREQVGPHRALEVVGDRARAARHPRQLDPPDRRRHAAQRRPRRHGGHDDAGDRGALGGQPAAGALDRGERRRRGGALPRRRPARATSPARRW